MDLSEDIFKLIISYMYDIRDIFNYKQTCKLYYHIRNDSMIIHNRVYIKIPPPYYKPPIISPHDMYLSYFDHAFYNNFLDDHDYLKKYLINIEWFCIDTRFYIKYKSLVQFILMEINPQNIIVNYRGIIDFKNLILDNDTKIVMHNLQINVDKYFSLDFLKLCSVKKITIITKSFDKLNTPKKRKLDYFIPSKRVKYSTSIDIEYLQNYKSYHIDELIINFRAKSYDFGQLAILSEIQIKHIVIENINTLTLLKNILYFVNKNIYTEKLSIHACTKNYKKNQTSLNYKLLYNIFKNFFSTIINNNFVLNFTGMFLNKKFFF